jgi:hypothetical protein
MARLAVVPRCWLVFVAAVPNAFVVTSWVSVPVVIQAIRTPQAVKPDVAVSPAQRTTNDRLPLA